MNPKKLFVLLIIAAGASSCATLNTGQSRFVPDLRVDLRVNSLHAKEIQEKGMLGAGEGDELTLVYTINAYDAAGGLVAVNNGFWGTRTTPQNALILADEFDKVSVHIPKEGKIIAAFALLEIDDYKGERKIAQVKNYTKTERYPKFLGASSFSDDQNKPALELIDNSLKVAGYKYFKSRHMNLSINDELGSTKKVLDGGDVNKILSSSGSGKETFEMDGTQINEKYLYVLKYDLNVARSQK